MPTFNQLVRKGRQTSEKKSTKEVFVQQLRQLLRRNRTQL